VSIMNVLMPSPAAQAAETRTLGMAPAAQAQAAQPVAATQEQVAAAAAAAPGDGAAQATMGAEAVQPPNKGKTILGSVLRGAATGASMMFGINTFGAKIPFVAKMMTSALKFIPFLSKVGFPMGTVVALGAGAVVGGIIGLVTGMKKANKEQAAWNEQQAAAQQAAAEQAAAAQAAQQGIDPATGQPVAVDPATGMPAGAPGDPNAAPPAEEPPAKADARKKGGKAKKNPVMDDDYRAGSSKKGSKATKADKAGDADSGPGRRHHVRPGDTLWALSRRFGVSIDDIVKANPKIKDPDLIYAGDTLVIPRG
jgi:nucleoid-associated protein YgaU